MSDSIAEINALILSAQQHRAAGRVAEAIAAFREVLALRPDIPEVHNDLGNLFLWQGDFDRARQTFEAALALNPRFAEAHNNLGALWNNAGRHEPAIACFRQALAIKPAYPEAHNNLGLALHNQGKPAQALPHFQQALVLKPDMAGAYCNVGNALRDLGDLDRAVLAYRQALTINPDFADAHNNLGKTLADLGIFEAALTHFERAISLQPDFPEAHFNRSEIVRFEKGDARLSALESLAANPARVPQRKLPYVHFALGKALEEVGDYARAFEQFAQGNALKRQQFDYDEQARVRSFQNIMAAFTPELMTRLAGTGDPSVGPIFILGMPRSGSSLVEQILASHPLVHGGGEMKNLGLLASRVRDPQGRQVSYAEYVPRLMPDDVRRIGNAYLASLPTLPVGKHRVTDKMPANFLYAGLIHLILPGARIIHTVRNPIDTCLSCFTALFASGQRFSYDLAEVGRYYHRYQQLMDHWRAVLPAGAMLDVAYENVVDNFEVEARRLVAFCGLPWDDRCLNFHATNRPIKTASNYQVRQPLYRRSLARWRRYEAHLAPLMAALEFEDSPVSLPAADIVTLESWPTELGDRSAEGSN
ncbi:MAG TPA: tetratricopeptide repeat protein [Pirellulales bacterium]|nr:tetratricopeptide repeat protein [Pirellulales bacterium]